MFAWVAITPTVAGALEQVLRGLLAGLVQLDVPLLAGLLAERLTGYVPWLEKLFFCNLGAEAVEAAIKFSRATTVARPSCIATTPSTA